MITITVTIEQMAEQALDCMKDILLDNIKSKSSFTTEIITIQQIAEALTWRDMTAIRQMFIEGHTLILIPQKEMELISGAPDAEEAEIRVYDDKKLLGVIINSEISF